MDMLFEEINHEKKIRLHFHRFMQNLHESLKQYEGTDPLKKIIKVSPLNNFFKIPEIVIDKIATYKRTWFNFAINFCPTNILGLSLGLGLSILFNNLKITK